MNQLPFKSSSDYISKFFKNVHHDIAIVLGSGLGGFTKHLSDKVVLSTNDIPEYPRSTVVGHSGEIISAAVGEKRVLVFSGRDLRPHTGATPGSGSPNACAARSRLP